MINKLIDAISLKLNSEFGDTYKTYTEEVKQGLKTPCFFINTLNDQENLFRENKYFKVNPFVIQYIPNGINKKIECNEVKERLFNSLEYITIKEQIEENDPIDSLVRGSKMSSEYVDGVLSFFINYDMYVYKEKIEKDKMETYSHDNNVKG